MEMLHILQAEEGDLPRILEIYAYAREFMRKTGNPTQWKDHLPEKKVLIRDIEAGNLYVVKVQEDIHGVFALIIGEEPTYSIIEQGSWKSNDVYGTLHRIASDGKVHGIFEQIMQFSYEKIHHLRIDTHQNNKVMQHLICKNGFEQCGIIYVADGSERIAYEKI